MNQAALPVTESRRQEVQSAIKNACDHLRADGVNPRDYVEQLAWMFFLKSFDEAQTRREQVSASHGHLCPHRLPRTLRWSVWSKELINKPDQLLVFVDGSLWPELRKLGEDPLGQQFKRIFDTVRNHCRTGASFAKVVHQVNRLDFGADTDIIVLSEIYEGLLKDVAADSAGYAGEFYTQRHITRAMVELVGPRLGDRIYDPCFGTAGFLVESADFMLRHRPSLGSAELATLQHNTLYGVEQKPLTYLLGAMNLLLHGIEGAGLELANTLEIHQDDVPDAQKYQVILANPPYGGRLSRANQDNFTIPSGSTEVLFLQHIMSNLAVGGRAAVIIPEGVMFRGGADARVRERLVSEFDLHTVLSLPAGCFYPYTGVKTNVLFFDRPPEGRTTTSVWFYELTHDGFELKQARRPIAGNQLPDFLQKQKTRAASETSWSVPVEEIAAKNWDLTAKSPHRPQDGVHASALELVQSMRSKEERILELLQELEVVLGNGE